MAGITSYGVYVPRYRLSRESITVPPAVGVSAPMRGTRAVAGFDEDSTSMGVEAARAALASADPASEPAALYFATTSPAYFEKTNAALIHAALGLPQHTTAIDLLGSVRSAAGALHLGLQHAREALVVLSEVRASLPGGADEREGGDAAVAFTVTGAHAPVLAELIGAASVTEEFLDRWRVLEEPTARRWEERFGQEVYQRLGHEALQKALQQAGLEATALNHLVIASANTRAMKSFGKLAGAKPAKLASDLVDSIGNTGAAHVGLLLATTLDRAGADEIIAVVTLADGAEALIFRTTQRLIEQRTARQPAQRVQDSGISISYTSYLQWRGLLATEQPRRPDPADPAAPTTLRATGWKLRFTGSLCTRCGEQHYPPQRVCQRCGAVDQMKSTRPTNGQGTVVTSVVDRLAWSPQPPIVVAVVDLDGGGRAQCEVTETDGTQLVPGSRVELTFRRTFTTRNGIHNYFWKMRPVAAGRGQ